MNSSSIHGLVSVPSQYSVPQTLDKLEAILREKGIKIFARIDQREEASTVGMEMRPAQLLIFGNPKGGTPIMQISPAAAIDLPLKALAWQDAEGKVWLSYNDPEYLKSRFHLSEELIRPILGMSSLIDKAAA